MMVRTGFYSWSESTAYVTVSVPAKYCNHPNHSRTAQLKVSWSNTAKTAKSVGFGRDSGV